MKKSLILSLIIFICSCSSNVQGSWSCPAVKGGKGNCISIGEADNFKLSNSDQLITEGYFSKQQKIEIKLIAPKLADLKKLNNSQVINPVSTPQNKLRTEEKVGRVWFAPYIDSDGNQHSESVIFVVDEKPKWISQR